MFNISDPIAMIVLVVCGFVHIAALATLVVLLSKSRAEAAESERLTSAWLDQQDEATRERYRATLRAYGLD